MKFYHTTYDHKQHVAPALSSNITAINNTAMKVSPLRPFPYPSNSASFVSVMVIKTGVSVCVGVRVVFVCVCVCGVCVSVCVFVCVCVCIKFREICRRQFLMLFV